MIKDENYIAKMNQTTEQKLEGVIDKIQTWLDDEISMTRCLNESEIQSQDDAISYGRAEMAKALSEYIESIKNVRKNVIRDLCGDSYPSMHNSISLSCHRC